MCAMHPDEEARLLDKLRKIEALFAGTTFTGERAAAENARERIRERLRQFERSERAVEHRLTLEDPWSRMLFMALARRYGLEPYRYSGQRRTTVMVKGTRSFVDHVLWPAFGELNATLREHLTEVTRRVIRQAIDGDASDAGERAGTPPPIAGGTPSIESAS